jgi:glycosyltransferase involved in cell wall biosynthesis
MQKTRSIDRMSQRDGPRWVVLNQSQSPMFQRMIERLAERFGPCVLLTGMPHDVVKGSPLTVQRGPSYDASSMMSRLLSWVRFELWALLELQRVDGPRFVFAVSNPFMNTQLAWFLRQIGGARFGLLIWDIYPDHVVKIGWASETNPLVRLWRLFNRLALAEADAVVTLGASMARTLGEQAPDDAVPIRVIPNWADTEQFRPRERSKNDFVCKHELEDVFCVLYSGNMGGSHDMETIGRAAVKLREREDIKFVLVGEGMGRVQIESIVDDEQLDNVLLLPYQPWETLPWSLAAGHVGIVSQAANSNELSVPSKTYSLLAVGNPILAVTPSGSDLAELIETHQVGVFSPPGDAQALADQIESFADDPERVRRFSRAAREAAVEHFSEDAIYEQLADVLAGVPGMEEMS